MDTKKLKYFYKSNFLNPKIHESFYKEILEFQNHPAVLINSDGSKLLHDQRTNHIRNNCLDENYLDTILTPTIKHVKNILRPLVVENGLKNPVIKGLQNYYNPDSIKWHKDYIRDDLKIDDGKRFITFMVVSPEPIQSTFMVGPTLESVDLWNLGFKINLEPNLLIGHNNYLGHEYIKLQDSKISIFSFLWYDIS